MTTEGTGRGEFAQTVTNHVFRHEDLHKYFAIVDFKGMTNEVRENHGPARPSLDWALAVSVIHLHARLAYILSYVIVVLGVLIVGTAWGQLETNQGTASVTFPVAMNASPFSSIQPRPKLPVEPD